MTLVVQALKTSYCQMMGKMW